MNRRNTPSLHHSNTPLRHRFFRPLAVLTCFTMVNLSVPFGAVYTLGTPLREGLEKLATKQSSNPAIQQSSRPLSAKEQRTLQGKAGNCPYLAGTSKWDPSYKGVDLITGNYTVSTTDMSFDGGYGIPVNVTRSYSSNDGNETPYGYGWSMSADVRSTAGGLLKSKGAPIRSVPVNYRDRPTQQTDPNIAIQPVDAVTATDGGGKEETVQRDADGVLTTPPWDNNVTSAIYEMAIVGGSTYQILHSNTALTLDGTVYTYTKEGSYPNGTLPWNANQITPYPTPTPANVLKVTSAVDRQGNTTNYVYNQSVWVTFNKIDGQTQEHPLTQVNMPNGHTINFTWGNGTNAPVNRIVSISDGVRTVSYGYANGLLTSVTTPGGKTTTFGYGSASYDPNHWSMDVSTNLLTSITDPRGLSTQMFYCMGQPILLPYNVNVPEAPFCFQVNTPDGRVAFFTNPGVWIPGTPGTTPTISFGESVGGTNLFTAEIPIATTSNPPTVNVQMQTWNPAPPGGTFPIANWSRTYDAYTQNLLTDVEDTHFRSSGSLVVARDMFNASSWQDQSVTTTTVYNFMGNPLLKTVTEHESGETSPPPDFTYSTGYAYWDSSKYYQQKAVAFPLTGSNPTYSAGTTRVSYTDYFPNTANPGQKGQQYEVFDPKNATFYLNTNPTPPIPVYAPSYDYWKYEIQPVDTTKYTAQFVYDTLGRATDVYKLQSTTGSYRYVQTHTTYGANTDGSWGQAATVVEDYGGVGRTTNNLSYTSWGKPNKVSDAAGHIFLTAFDNDGLVQSVTRTDVTPNVTLVSYQYGSSYHTVSYGQPLSVTDGLSSVVDGFTYQPSGAGIGQVSQVSESGGGNPSYAVNYLYDSVGRRAQATYTTPNATKEWGYGDYQLVGSPEKAQFAFQTLTLLNNTNGNPTAEAMHYAYDSSGRLQVAAFAQSPASGFTPTGSNPWYDSSHEASVRARAMYDYDAAGRVRSVQHYWDTWGGTAYTTIEAILANSCAYELSGLNRGLKTSSSFYNRQSPGSPNWNLLRTETYGYDSQLDYLTSANYGDGLPNQTPSWTYDAAGNRTDSVCDNLNRTTNIGGVTANCDILGNRLSLGSTTTYGWDALNRMTSLTNGTSNSYAYRADGMRVAKFVGSTGTTTLYRYDGQMGMEDVDTAGSGTTVTDYGIGARGIDYIAATTGSGTNVGFPIYDAHGNMIACLFRSGTNYYSVANQRAFDAWGIIRQGATSSDPKGRYCATLGHKQDDESGLIYMRARYYEPGSGRFISEDSARHNANWFIYCYNNPLGLVDSTGLFEASDEQLESWISQLILSSMSSAMAKFINLETLGLMMAFLATEGVVFSATGRLALLSNPEMVQKSMFVIDALYQVQITQPSPAASASPAAVAVGVDDAESLQLQLIIWTLDV